MLSRQSRKSFDWMMEDFSDNNVLPLMINKSDSKIGMSVLSMESKSYKKHSITRMSSEFYLKIR